ncbi:MAG: DUF975 family protein [Oscillospiraceae bacterium]|nr:DUF975 family protein [Oscillospiraceae bacterium]
MNWTISGLKENAKSVLKDFYWKGVLAALIFGILCGGLGGSSSSATGARKSWEDLKEQIEEQNNGSTYSWETEDSVGGIIDMSFTTDDGASITINAPAAQTTAVIQPVKTADDFDEMAIFGAVMGVVAVIVIIAAALGSLYTIFVGNIIQVGYRKFHLDARYERNNVDIMKLFSMFKNGYGNVAKTMFFRDLYVFLWSLLLIIPGIIKGYEYFLVPYILAENPNIDRDRAFEISRRTMDGEKMNCFLLGLSFIGWTILAGLVPLGIGNIFVFPYLYATYAEFYCCMKAKAITNGIALPGELPEDYQDNNFFDQSYPTSSDAYSANGGYNGYNSTQSFGSQPAQNNGYQNTSGMQPYKPYSDFGNSGTMDNISTDDVSAPQSAQPADNGYPSGTMDEIGDIDTSALDRPDDDQI